MIVFLLRVDGGMLHTERCKDIPVDVGDIIRSAGTFDDIRRQRVAPVGIGGVLAHMECLIALAALYRVFEAVINIIGSRLLIFVIALLKARVVTHEMKHGDLLIGILQFGEESFRKILADIGMQVEIAALPLLHDGSPDQYL